MPRGSTPTTASPHRFTLPRLFAVGALALAVALPVRSAEAPRLINLSTRGQAGAGDNALITGFVIGDGAAKTVVLRAIGPGLAGALSGYLANPSLTLHSGPTALATNDDWLSADAAAMQAVGAFALAGSSLDAVLVRDLSPGPYSAVVPGTAAAANLALVEVYDATGGTSRLLNLSTRGLVGTGDKVLIAGLVVGPGTGARRVLLRGAGPALAAYFGSGALANPTISLLNSASGALVALNDNWSGSGDSAALGAAFAQVGAFPFATGSLDSALVVDLAPGTYTLVLSGVGNTTGIALAEIYDLTTEGVANVSVAASRATADEAAANSAEFTFTRTGDLTAPLTVTYTLGGTATGGQDYAADAGSVTFAAGSASATVPIVPLGDFAAESTETVIATVGTGAGYAPVYPAVAAVSITDVAPTLFVGYLRPDSTTVTSGGSGSSTVLLSPDGATAKISVAFSNLSSSQTVAYLRLGNPGEVGTELARLPLGQVDGAYWSIGPRGAYSAADILRALREGRVFVSLETSNYPAGELRGAYLLGSGSQVFTPPAAVPDMDLDNLTDTDAARFLTQATFGATSAAINDLRATGIPAWLDTQFALPATLHRPEVMADFAANNAGGQNAVNGVNTRPGPVHRQHAWWKSALTAPDQLRQRTAFALSELFVVSDVNGTIFNNQEGAANYYDLLVNGAFGNFRTLLENLTLSPVMGAYLSHLRNARAESPSSPQPDENYAREVMQLFTIGLSQLQPDGTLKLGSNALPIPTYDQTTITETAKVFTGWAYYNLNPTNNNFRTSAANFINPMTLYAGYHDTSAKTIVGGLRLAAGRTGLQDLKDTLDALFNHPNTAPFVSRQLIQRLVTSNPSPGYVYRVAQVFANDGSGTRGDLGAVVRAILTDYEARAPGFATTPGYGKLKEPLLRVTGLLRAAGFTSTTGRYAINNANASLSQSALSAPTVFNFFEPAYVQPGNLAAAGLVAPEFQILTASTAISAPNYLYNYIFNATYQGLSLTHTDLLPLVSQPAALVDRLNLLLAANGLTSADRTRIINALSSLPTATTATDRVRSALYLIATTSGGAVQQ